MTLSKRALRIRKRLVAFADDRRAVSAVEFALLAPLMITLYLGGVEVTQAVTADRKTTLVAHTVADLIAQMSKVTNSDMTNIMNASVAVAAPLRDANLTVIVASLTIDANGTATVVWSDALHTTALSANTVKSIPSTLATPNTTLIYSEVTYTYKPAIGYVITGPLTLTDKTYVRPRLGNAITRSAT